VERHFLDLSQRYGDVVAVDLTDKVSIMNLFSLLSGWKQDGYPSC
jgi:hypothetical protein